MKELNADEKEALKAALEKSNTLLIHVMDALEIPNYIQLRSEYNGEKYHLKLTRKK